MRALLRAGFLIATTLGIALAAIAACDDGNDVAAPPATGAPMDASTPQDGAPTDGALPPPPDCTPSTVNIPQRPLRVLFLTKEALYKHDAAHEVGDIAVPAYLRSRGHVVSVTNDVEAFTSTGLLTFDVIVFFVTSGEVFVDASVPQDEAYNALISFVQSGHGIVGVHTASATNNASQFMDDLIGASFLGHAVGDAQVTSANLIVDDPSSPLVSFLPSPWTHTDEWYYFTSSPAQNKALHFLLSVDESTLPPEYPDAGRYGAMGHPLSWTQEYRCGRMFYTALGHRGEAYQEDLFLQSIAAGLEWAGAPSSVNP